MSSARSVVWGRGLLALASASLAVWSLAYGDFATSQPLPAWMPWRQVWIHGSALLLLAASIGVCWARTALPSLRAIGAYLALWAALSAPGILAKPLSIGAWYPLCEALTGLVGAMILQAMVRWQWPQSPLPVGARRAVRAAQVLFGLTCVFYGWSHFAYADYTAGMVPGWLPQRLGVAYFTGLGHIAAGIGIIVGIVPWIAATLEAIMVSLFGLLVWVPSFFMQPRPAWATPPENQWSELVVSVLLAAAAWIVAISLKRRSSGVLDI